MKRTSYIDDIDFCYLREFAWEKPPRLRFRRLLRVVILVDKAHLITENLTLWCFAFSVTIGCTTFWAPNHCLGIRCRHAAYRLPGQYVFSNAAQSHFGVESGSCTCSWPELTGRIHLFLCPKHHFGSQGRSALQMRCFTSVKKIAMDSFRPLNCVLPEFCDLFSSQTLTRGPQVYVSAADGPNLHTRYRITRQDTDVSSE